MSEFKEYMWCTSNSAVRPIMLRETKAYFIDKEGNRFKKGDFSCGALARSTATGFYYIRNLDCPVIKEWAEAARKKNFVYQVREQVDKMIRRENINYDKAVELAEKLELKID